MKIKYLILFMAAVLFSCERNSDINDILLKFYGDAYEDIGYSVSETDNGYVITGQITRLTRDGNYILSDTNKVAVIRTDYEGNSIGEPQIFGGKLPGSGTKVLTLEDGTIVAVGYVVDTVTNKKDIYAVKLNPGGDYDQLIYKRTGNQYATDVIQTQDGFLILGTTDIKREPSTEVTGNAAGKKDIFLLRVNNNLDTLAPIPAVGFIGNDEGVAIKHDLGGGYIVAGTTDRSDRPASEQSGNNVFLLRVNSDGSTTQPRIVGGTLNETASDFEVLSDGYLIAGTIGDEGSADQRGYIWKMPRDIYNEPDFMHEIVIEQFSASAPFSINAMCKYKTSSFLLAGQHGTGLSSRMLIFSVDAFGELVEGRIKIVGATGTQEAFDVISDNSDNVIAVGSNSYENNSMICFLKFRF
jgi:hypothetical protein